MNDLRLDYFLEEERKLYQDPDHFCFNTDTKLLALFMKIKRNERILDIGCNNGALLYGCDDKDVKELVGVEIQEEACKVARLNVKTFFKHDVRIENIAIQNYQDDPFDVILCNPPYFPVLSTHPEVMMNPRQLGRIEIHLNLEELIFHASRLLKSNGRFYFVHRPNRLNAIAKALYQNRLQIKTLQFAYDKDVSKSVLIEAIKESKCDCKVLQPLQIQ